MKIKPRREGLIQIKMNTLINLMGGQHIYMGDFFGPNYLRYIFGRHKCG